MKNLELLELIHKPISASFKNSKFAQTAQFTYFVSNNLLYKHDFNLNLTTELYPLDCHNLIAVKALIIENKVCVVTSTTLYICDPDGSKDIQSVSFENISAISWNPTEELVVIVSENGSVSAFNIDYESAHLYPQSVSHINAKIPDTVYVGWGSKDTQFRGSEGKLKNQKPIQAAPVNDNKPTISWRGNGEMFVVNYYEAEKRKFVVFEAPCTALYRSEDCPGLQPPIAWRPAGNMIATIAITNSSRSVVIFEKNGQKRFNFDLNFEFVRIKDLKWSPCANILAILSEDDEKTQTLHLLMSSNYKWYEKQTLTFGENNLLDFEWLDSTQFTFSIKVVTEKEIVKYTFTTKINNANAVCGVINGKDLQLTDFSDSVIPPIMYFKKIENELPINFVIMNNSLIGLIDSKNQLKIYDLEKLDVIHTFDIGTITDLSKFPLSCHHFTFKNRKIVFAAEKNSETIIYNFDVETNEVGFITAVNGPIRFTILTSLYTENIIRKEVKVIDSKTYDCQLSANCHFFLNDQKLNDYVNSFLIFDNYLLLTTKLNELHCIKLTEELNSVNYRRNIEQGATIVTAITNSPKIVLQMPRGNLETISCRLISIDMLDRLLNEDKWDEAIRFIRLEKLNANLLFDLNPERFLSQIDKFIDNIKTINELNSLCLEFEQSNVFNTIYKNCSKKTEAYNGKIKAIFCKIFNYFDKVGYIDYITTIMAINLTFFNLREALIYLQDILRRSYDDISMKQKLIEAINTLKIYGCDQEKLYNESLLLYDLDLASFVASCCQLDPRIYQPHIANLRNLSEVKRRFEINVYGKKPKIAIAYLLRCPDIPSEEILEFIEKNQVCREAYENCLKTNRHFEVVSRVFAQKLSKLGSHKESGIVLKRAGLLKEALEEFKLCLDWREVLNLLEELKVEQIEKIQIVNDLAEQLDIEGLVKDAAFLYEFHVGNYEMALKVLLEEDLLEEAVHIAKKYNRRDVMISEVVPLIYEQKRFIKSELNCYIETFIRDKTNLAVARQSRVDKINNYDDSRDDLFSDVGSTITKSSRSSRSRSSTASSRKRRKEQRKKFDTTPGSVYEDIALVRELHSIIKAIYHSAERVHTCCLLLIKETDCSYSEAKEIHDMYWKIIDEVKIGINEIWPEHFRENYQTQNVQQLADLKNFDLLDIEFRTPPAEPKLKKLNIFDK